MLRNERALLSAMTCVGLNPVRAYMAAGLNQSKYTTIRKRHRVVLKQPELANQPLVAIVGINSLNMPLLTNAETRKSRI